MFIEDAKSHSISFLEATSTENNNSCLKGLMLDKQSIDYKA